MGMKPEAARPISRLLDRLTDLWKIRMVLQVFRAGGEILDKVAVGNALRFVPKNPSFKSRKAG